MITKIVRYKMTYDGFATETIEVRIFGILVYRRLVNGGCP